MYAGCPWLGRRQAFETNEASAMLHVDMGGGTTKLALIDNGKIVGVGAFAVGGRLLAQDASGAWTRIDDSARSGCQDLGFKPTRRAWPAWTPGDSIARRLAEIAMDYILGAPLGSLGAALQLTEPLPRAAHAVGRELLRRSFRILVRPRRSGIRRHCQAAGG